MPTTVWARHKKRYTWLAVSTFAQAQAPFGDGHPGSPDCAALTLAEWACRAADWLDPSRMPGSHRHLGEAHLRQVLKAYAAYYNHVRTHLALTTKDAPLSRPVHRFGDVIAKPILGGLHHEYCRI